MHIHEWTPNLFVHSRHACLHSCVLLVRTLVHTSSHSDICYHLPCINTQASASTSASSSQMAYTYVMSNLMTWRLIWRKRKKWFRENEKDREQKWRRYRVLHEGVWWAVTARASGWCVLMFVPDVRVLQCVAVCCSVLRCVAVCWSVLQYVAVCRSMSQCVAVCRRMLQRVAMCCSVLQCVAVCRSMSQCVAVCCSVL